MSGTTTNLELFKYNPNTDGDQTFNIDNALNNNFDKLDTVIGALANLTTEQKTNLVAAINEIITNLGGKAAKDLSNLDSIGQGILDAKIEAEALTAQNGYIKFKLNGISNSIILQWIRVETTTHSTFYFPTSYTSTNYIVLTSHEGISPSSNYIASSVRKNSSSFEVYSGKNDNTIYICAIGY